MRMKLYLGVAVMCAACFFCSCAAVREARRVQRGEKTEQGEKTVSAESLGLHPDAEISLSRLEEIVLQQIPSVARARNAVRKAEIALREAGAADKPAVTGSAGHTRSTQNRDRHRQSTRNTGSWSGSLSLRWTLWDFGQTSAAVRHARATLRAAEKDLRYAEITALHNVRKAFFEIRRREELLVVAQESVRQYREHLEQVETKLQVGKAVQYEKSKALSDLYDSELQLLTAEFALKNAWTTLNRHLGLSESVTFHLGEATVPEYPLVLQELMGRARESDPMLSSLVAREEGAREFVDQQISALYPSLGLSLGASASGRNPGMPWLWQLSGGASLTQTLFDWGGNLRRVESATLELRNARTQVAEREQELFASLHTAVLDAQQAEQALSVAKNAAACAGENLEIVNERFDLGKASSVERTDAQVGKTRADAAVVTALYDWKEAHLALALLLGE